MTDHTTDPDAAGTVAFAYEMGVLKRAAQSWLVACRCARS